MNIAIIPARGGSKRIPHKNIKDFNGKPIIAYSIEKAIQSELFEAVIVSTDNEEIAEVAQKFGVVFAFRLAQIFDLLAVLSLLVVGTLLSLSYPFYIGILVVVFLMAYKYIIVSPRDVSNMKMAFFRVNALVSTVVFLSTVASLLVTKIEW